ncbi:hypothetical protein QQP08_018252 [Theobroma cacao]|nr:hypothetical protein QQP08_018252 [Theobroma cacao]
MKGSSLLDGFPWILYFTISIASPQGYRLCHGRAAVIFKMEELEAAEEDREDDEDEDQYKDF